MSREIFKAVGRRIPMPGDAYYPDFESDYLDGSCSLAERRLTIRSVDPKPVYDYDKGLVQGFTVFAGSDRHADLGYDCFWSEKLGAWVYALGDLE